MWSFYKTIATILWVIVVALVAVNGAVLYALPMRQTLFVVACVIGIVLLISINWPYFTKKSNIFLPRKLMSGEKPLLASSSSTAATPTPPIVTPLPTTHPTIVPLATSDTTLEIKAVKEAMPSGQAGEKKLSPEESRQWLDELLLKQQKKP